MTTPPLTPFAVGQKVAIRLKETCTYCCKCGVAAPARFSKYCGDGSDKDNEHRWISLAPTSPFVGTVTWLNGDGYIVDVQYDNGKKATWKCMAEWLSPIGEQRADSQTTPPLTKERRAAIVEYVDFVKARNPDGRLPMGVEGCIDLLREIDRLESVCAAQLETIDGLCDNVNDLCAKLSAASPAAEGEG